ncbi:hypothetical protein [uncultured Amnibacterium sp.]|uniref:hypothetical protein n=1 Tax=uncultured Amnibacterium sp. TaxID=1631851 RepID=UPI0035CB35C5
MTVRQRITMWVGIVLFLLGAWILLTSTGQWLGRLPGDTRTAVIGLVGIVLVPVITFFTSRAQERRRARDDAIREKRTQFYDMAIRGMLRMFNLDKTAKPSTPNQQMKFFADITPEFILYASRGVVLAWNNFRKLGQQGSPSQGDFIAAFENVFREMRKDLGHDVPARPNLELMALFVNDIDNLNPKKRKKGLQPAEEQPE